MLAILLLSSFGVEVDKQADNLLDATAAVGGGIQQVTEVTPVLPPPVEKIVKGATELICGEDTYVPEFLACGEEIGRSSEKRPIYIFTAGPPSPEATEGQAKKVLFIGGLHTGSEKNTYELATKVLQYFYGKPERVPEYIELYIIPKTNPDGIANSTHNNAKNVDLNRNWPTQDWRSDPYHPAYGYLKGGGGKAPLSEPETKALYDFVKNVQPEMIFTWHSQAGTVEDNDIRQADELAEIYAKAANYQHIKEWPHYETTGTFLEAMREIDIPAADVELRTRNHEFERNIKAVNEIIHRLKGGQPSWR